MILFLASIIAGLGSVGITIVLRAIPPFEGWNERGIKPWACDLCMSFWCSAICLAVGVVFAELSPSDAFMAWMPSFVVAFGTIQRIIPVPLGDPPIDPPSGSP